MDLNQFADLMEKRVKVIPQRLVEIKKQVATLVLENVVKDTPVDTGLAKSNWIVNLGSPVDFTRPAFAPGFKGSSGSANDDATIAAGRAVINGAKAGIDIHITNNVPYIRKLNQGYSRQAPSNYVDDAALRASMLIKNAKVIVS